MSQPGGVRRRRPRSPQPRGARPSSKYPLPAKAERLAFAWIGCALIAVAAAGLQWADSLQIVWIVMLIFGVATIPQVMIWWILELRRRR